MAEIANCDYITYFLNTDEIYMGATVTGAFFENVNGTHYEVQVSDIDIDFKMEDASWTNGLVPMNAGRVALTPALKQVFIDSGSPESYFRRMTVGGTYDLLFQLVPPGALVQVCKEAELSPHSDVYLGPIEDIEIKVERLKEAPISCIRGREYNQDIFLLGSFLHKVSQKVEFTNWSFRLLPVYDEMLWALAKGEWDSKAIDCGRFDDEFYLGILRNDELFYVLEYAGEIRDKELGEKIFKGLKYIQLPMEDKKRALSLVRKVR